VNVLTQCAIVETLQTHQQTMSRNYDCNYLYYQFMFVPSHELLSGWYISHKTNIPLWRTRDIKAECIKLAHSCRSVLTRSACQIDVPFRCTTYPRRGCNWFTPPITTHTGRYQLVTCREFTTDLPMSWYHTLLWPQSHLCVLHIRSAMEYSLIGVASVCLNSWPHHATVTPVPIYQCVSSVN